MATGALSLPPVTGASTQNSQTSWEGDKMFNIYIYDYCNKRGFRETAQKLMVEAEIPPDSQPPINAKQGLLFEWWSVFWVLFTAKSNGTGSDDAMLYVQQQSQQAVQRQAQARMQPQAQPINRFMNGIQRPPGAMPPNGQMPNGVGPASLQGAQGPMPNGAPGSMSFPMSGSGPQPNGIPGTPAGPSAPGSTPQQQQPGFQQMLPGQRQGGPQQRGPNNGPSFQSPTMAHSPQNTGGGPVQQQPPPMGQLGPSPHMSHMQRGGNMLPPNGQQQATNPAFQQLQRPPSRTASPSNIMTQPSPSMAARQPPGGMANPQDANFNIELSKIPVPVLTALRQEIGLADKDLQLYTADEKQRLITIVRQRTGNMKPGPPGPNNAAAGPSMQSNQRPQRQSVSQQRGNKRNSTSPAEEHESLPRNDQSPPDRKRPRRSPLNAEQAPSMGAMNYPQQGQQPGGGQGGPQQLPNGMMRPMGTPGLNGFPPGGGGMQNMGNPGMNMQMGGQQMGGSQMNPQGMAAAQQMARFQQEQQYRQSMHSLHKGGLPVGALNNAIPGNAGSPSGDSQGQGPQFAVGGGPNSRMNPKGMMLPPSPASGPSKDQSGQNKDKGGQATPSNRPEGSPRNPPRTPAQGGSNMGNPGQGGTAPPTPNMTAPSPSAILSNPPSGMNQPMVPSSDPMAIFGATDFISSMPALDGFDEASLSKASFDVDFERDFGQWFNPENDVAGSLDPK